MFSEATQENRNAVRDASPRVSAKRATLGLTTRSWVTLKGLEDTLGLTAILESLQDSIFLRTSTQGGACPFRAVLTLG